MRGSRPEGTGSVTARPIRRSFSRCSMIRPTFPVASGSSGLRQNDLCAAARNLSQQPRYSTPLSGSPSHTDFRVPGAGRARRYRRTVRFGACDRGASARWRSAIWLETVTTWIRFEPLAGAAVTLNRGPCTRGANGEMTMAEFRNTGNGGTPPSFSNKKRNQVFFRQLAEGVQPDPSASGHPHSSGG